MGDAGSADGQMPEGHRGGVTAASHALDDVVMRRARLKRVANLGQRTGYGLYGASLVCGAVGIRWGYTPLLSTLIAVALVVGSMLLLPTIIMSYGIRAAEREERQAAATANAERRPDGRPTAGPEPAHEPRA